VTLQAQNRTEFSYSTIPGLASINPVAQTILTMNVLVAVQPPRFLPKALPAPSPPKSTTIPTTTSTSLSPYFNRSSSSSSSLSSSSSSSSTSSRFDSNSRVTFQIVNTIPLHRKSRIMEIGPLKQVYLSSEGIWHCLKVVWLFVAHNMIFQNRRNDMVSLGLTLKTQAAKNS